MLRPPYCGGASDSGGAGDPLSGCLGRNGPLSVAAEDTVDLCCVRSGFLQWLECLPSAGMLRWRPHVSTIFKTALAAAVDIADSPLHWAGALVVPRDVEPASPFLGGLGYLQ